MYIEDDAGNITEVRTGAFVSLSSQKKNKDDSRYGSKVRVCDLPLPTEGLRLDFECS